MVEPATSSLGSVSSGFKKSAVLLCFVSDFKSLRRHYATLTSREFPLFTASSRFKREIRGR